MKKSRESRDHVVLVFSFTEFTENSASALKCNVEARLSFPDPICLGDYTEPELVQLLVRMTKQESLEVEGGFEDSSLRILVKCVLRRHGSESPSNKIHVLEVELDTVRHRFEKRLEQEWINRAKAHLPGKDETKPERPKLQVLKRKDIFGTRAHGHPKLQ